MFYRKKTEYTALNLRVFAPLEMLLALGVMMPLMMLHTHLLSTRIQYALEEMQILSHEFFSMIYIL